MIRPNPDDYGIDIYSYVLELERYCDWLEVWDDTVSGIADMVIDDLTGTH